MKLIDLKGRKYGRLTVIKKAEKRGREQTWLCECDCGNSCVVRGANLRNGHTKSCGCYNKERIIETQTIHGMRNTRLYNIWNHMRQRCLNPNHKRYADYGGRGITICEEWRNDFQAFYDWAMKNGYQDNLTIDREDNDGNYEPSNCRWSNDKEQSNNRRNNHYVSCKGMELTIAQWSEKTGINQTTIQARLDKGWTPERALEIDREG